MTFENNFLFILFVPAMLITLLVMILKKVKRSKIVFVLFCFISAIVYFYELFPLHFSIGQKVNVPVKFIPICNIINTLNIYTSIDGTLTREMNFFNMIINYLIIDCVLSVLIATLAFFACQNSHKSLVVSLIVSLTFLTVRIVFILAGATQSCFDTIEYLIVLVSALVGIVCAKNIKTVLNS